MRYTIPMRYALSLAIAAALSPTAAMAQDAAATPPEEEPAELDAIIVSGTAKFRGLSKRDASFSITTASPEQIQEAAPSSTADLLKIVPGVWAESSGGGTGANVFVRGMPSEGDAPFFTLQLDGSPIYPPPTLSFLENTTLFRIDDTIERVEALRGGPSPLYSNGQPGVTVNFIQKKGGDTHEGSARVTLGSDALRRVDLFDSGPLREGSGWYYSVGGFWRETDGVRDPGFASETGGQIGGTLTRRWDDGEFTVYGRHTNDRNVFYTAIPLLSRNDGDDISGFPGIDPTSGTLIGPDFRRVTLPTGIAGQSMTRDLADGRGVDITVFGGALDWNVGRWTISDRFNFLTGDAPTNGLFTGANPVRLADYITDTYATTGSGRFVNGGAVVDPNQQVLTAGWWVVDKELSSFTNDLRFSIDFNERNALTLGVYHARYSSEDRWWLGNNMLLTAENQARRVDLTLADGRIATREGFVGTSFYNIFGDYDGRNTAFFVTDEWKATDRLRLDAGVRHERQRVDGTVRDPVSVDLDGNPNTLYDNNTSVARNLRSIDQDDSATSWTVGANYTVSDTMSAFGRVNSGFKFPSFDNLRDGATQTQEIDQYEVGLKAADSKYELYLTVFYNDFVGLPFQAFDQNGNNIVVIGDSKAKGVEFEGAIGPFGGFDLAWTATWLKADYGTFGNFSGNQVVRQPKFRARLTPSYYWSMPWGDAKIFATWTNVGDRYSDPANGQVLPAYDTWDIGASARIGEHWEFTFNGRNVTDEIALTEGNARVIGNATSGGVFMGRPIEGASYQMSVIYRW
jgi:outer membrane receptor protein involved in Fe transport